MPPFASGQSLPGDYAPKMHTTKPLDSECSSFYQHLIGVTRWMVELCRVDIVTKISLLSSHLAYPREGHLEAALHAMGYLKQKHNSRLIFDPTYPDIDLSSFPTYDWTKFYGDVKEAIPHHNMPEPLDVRMFCDSKHAGEKHQVFSHWLLYLFCNMALIDWISKKQDMIETSVFGAM